jgi:hypothetical protein
MFAMTLTQAGFLELVWQSSPETRALAPPGHPRTLGDCALRLSQFGWVFDRLIEQGYPWFGPCVEIDRTFDSSKFGLIALTTLTPDEKIETPKGSYYIFDGVHRSIVLAKKLFKGAIQYKPVQAILLEPRRD